MQNSDKVQEAIATLRAEGYAVKVWIDGDIRSVISDDDYDLTDDQVEQVVGEVMASRQWRSLEDADEWEWEIIAYAVEDAVEQVTGKEV